MGLPPGVLMPLPQQNSSIAKAATGAQSSAQVSDQLVQQVMQHVIPFQGDMNSMVQNRPQVMLPSAIHPKQLGMTQPNQIAATTASGQKRNDISNIISGVSNVVKGAVNKRREAEDRDLTADLTLIQAASSNPDDPHNKAIIESLSQDSKRVKRLEKALGYNPFSGEPPPPETKTLMKFHAQTQQKQQQAEQVKAAIAGALGSSAAQQGQGPQTSIPGIQGGGGAMDRMMSRMPNTPQLSPMVQLQAGLIKAGILPSSDVSLQSMTTLVKEIMTDDAKYSEIQAKLQNTDKVLAGRLQEIHDRGQYLIKQQKMRDEAAGQRTDTRAAATVKSAKLRSDATVKAAELRQKAITDRQGLAQQHKLLQKEVDALDKDINGLNLQITQAVNDKDKPRHDTLIREQQMKKELKNAKEQLMDTLDKQSTMLDEQIKQSPTSLLNEPDAAGDNENEMDQEDRIF